MIKNKNAFTIVELLIVIAIIGILSTIGIVTFSKVRIESRDMQRSSRISIVAEALEKYYDQNGIYPSCASMTTQTANNVATSTLKGIDPSVLATPSASTGTNSFSSCTGDPATDVFVYVCGASCSQYTLKYKEESTGLPISLVSRRAALSDIHMNDPTVASSTQINLSWTTITSATSYTWQIATNSNFTTGLVENSTTSATAASTGLTTGTLYYYRVMPRTASNVGSWSNTVSANTLVNPPASYNISASNTYNTLTATSNATCQAGVTVKYDWYKNGSLWKDDSIEKTVSYTMDWGEGTTITVNSFCVTTTGSISTLVAATNNANMTRSGFPWAYVGYEDWHYMRWDGGCPAYTTSQNFYWNSGGAIHANGNTPNPGSYYSGDTAWGDGGTNVTLTCNGPWGVVTASAWHRYGPGCVPDILSDACYH